MPGRVFREGEIEDLIHDLSYLITGITDETFPKSCVIQEAQRITQQLKDKKNRGIKYTKVIHPLGT